MASLKEEFERVLKRFGRIKREVNGSQEAVEGVRNGMFRFIKRLRREFQGKKGGLENSYQKIPLDGEENSHPFKKKMALYEKSVDEEWKNKFQKLTANIQSQKKIRQQRKQKMLMLDYLKHHQLLKEQKQQRRLEEDKVKVKKEKLLESLRKKSLQRKQYLLNQRQLFSKTPPIKIPNYLKIQENYKTNVQFSQLQYKKTKLDQRKRYVSPINHREIAQHNLNYIRNSLKLQNQRKKNTQNKNFGYRFNTSKFSNSYRRYIQQLQQRKLEQQEIKYQKIKLKEKQSNYSQIVKEFYAPKRMEKIQQKQLPKIKSVTPTKETQKQQKLVLRSKFDQKKLKIRQIQSEKILPKVYDYLEIRRKHRENTQKQIQNLYTKRQKLLENTQFNQKSPQDILKRTRFIERVANRNRVLANSLSPFNPQALIMHEETDDILIDSIKAKLSLLNQISQQ